MRHTLICTVGTSLKSNLERHPEGRDWLELYSQGRFRDLARALAGLPPENRLLGAEINSTDSIMAKGILADPLYLHLLVSDTQDGQNLGQLLAFYYQEKKNPRRFEHVDWQPLVGLTDENPHRFKTQGLRHLVTAMATISRQRGPERVVINATGGYKAQISFAGLIGQALNIPVCYLFERFSEVIILPPQPVSLDLGFWLAHAPLFYQLAQDRGNPENYESIDPRFASLVEEIEVDGQKLVGLTPMGQLFHESFRYRFALQQSQLLPPDSGTEPAGKKITSEAGLSPRPPGIEAWFKKLLEVPYVTKITTYYYNPDLPRANYFKPSSQGEADRVEGGFSDGKATTKFLVFLTANTPAQRDAALSDLWERFLARE
jgi:putative CRISPR-associated protein (TIGR02619 family)